MMDVLGGLPQCSDAQSVIDGLGVKIKIKVRVLVPVVITIMIRWFGVARKHRVVCRVWG